MILRGKSNDLLEKFLKKAFVIIRKEGKVIRSHIRFEMVPDDLQGLIISAIHVDGAGDGVMGIGKNRCFFRPPIQDLALPEKEILIQPKLFRKKGQRASLNKMGPPHGERAFLGLWKFFKKKVAHVKVKNGVAEEFQNLIRHLVRSVGL